MTILSEISSMTLNVAEVDWVVGTELWTMVEAVTLIFCWRLLFIEHKALTFSDKSDSSFLMASFSSVSEPVVLESELSVGVKSSLLIQPNISCFDRVSHLLNLQKYITF